MGKVSENIRQAREAAGLSRKELGGKIGRSESTVRGYENGETITVDVLEKIAGAVGITADRLLTGAKQEKEKKKDPGMKVLIFQQQDRLEVASILIKNGYTVSQGKEKRTETGKILDYFLIVRRDIQNADTSRGPADGR